MDDDENEREKTERKNNFYVFFLVGSTKTADIAKVAMEERGEEETLLNEVHSCPRIKGTNLCVGYVLLCFLKVYLACFGSMTAAV